MGTEKVQVFLSITLETFNDEKILMEHLHHKGSNTKDLCLRFVKQMFLGNVLPIQLTDESYGLYHICHTASFVPI